MPWRTLRKRGRSPVALAESADFTDVQRKGSPARSHAAAWILLARIGRSASSRTLVIVPKTGAEDGGTGLGSRGLVRAFWRRPSRSAPRRPSSTPTRGFESAPFSSTPPAESQPSRGGHDDFRRFAFRSELPRLRRVGWRRRRIRCRLGTALGEPRPPYRSRRPLTDPLRARVGNTVLFGRQFVPRPPTTHPTNGPSWRRASISTDDPRLPEGA
jgi:hypothetical protein